MLFFTSKKTRWSVGLFLFEMAGLAQDSSRGVDEGLKVIRQVFTPIQVVGRDESENGGRIKRLDRDAKVRLNQGSHFDLLGVQSAFRLSDPLLLDLSRIQKNECVGCVALLKQSGGERIEFIAVFRISDADDIWRDFVI